MKPNQPIWRVIFWTAAAYNFLAGLPSLLAPLRSMSSIGVLSPDPQLILPIQIMGLLICVFGVGYAMVAQGMQGARQIVILGILGKLGLCVLVALRLAVAEVPSSMIVAVFGDFVFVLAFLAYLAKGPRAA